jgi:hypothetical protein
MINDYRLSQDICCTILWHKIYLLISDSVFLQLSVLVTVDPHLVLTLNITLNDTQAAITFLVQAYEYLSPYLVYKFH